MKNKNLYVLLALCLVTGNGFAMDAKQETKTQKLVRWGKGLSYGTGSLVLGSIGFYLYQAVKDAIKKNENLLSYPAPLLTVLGAIPLTVRLFQNCEKQFTETEKTFLKKLFNPSVMLAASVCVINAGSSLYRGSKDVEDMEMMIISSLIAAWYGKQSYDTFKKKQQKES